MTPAEAGHAGAIKPDARFMLSDPAHLIAQGFGSGLSPVMPGTSGTLFAWLSFHALSVRWPDVFTPGVWALMIVGFIAGIWACGRTARNMGVDDHGSMVWDEVIGFWTVLLFVTPAGFATQLWAFIWFRVFDMTKPPPIRQIDRHIGGGLGVMWDDVAAAFYTLLLFAVWRAL